MLTVRVDRSIADDSCVDCRSRLRLRPLPREDQRHTATGPYSHPWPEAKKTEKVMPEAKKTGTALPVAKKAEKPKVEAKKTEEPQSAEKAPRVSPEAPNCLS